MNLQFSENLISSTDAPQIVDWRRDLPVNKNYTWGQLTGGPRNLNDITTIVLHHDGIPKSGTVDRTDLQLATTIANNHIRSTSNEKKGDAGFPYHIWIRNGFAYYCNNLEDMTYGVSSNNGYTVHICVSGDYFNCDALTEKDRYALYAALYTVITSLPAYQMFKGHGEMAKTDCPGYSMARVRDDMITLQHKLASADSWQAKCTKVNELANQYQYMFDLMKAGEQDGNAAWAMHQLLSVRDVLKERGLL